MTIFSVQPNSNDYQSMCVMTSNSDMHDYLRFDCQRRESNWKPPTIYIPNSKLKRGDFFQFEGASGSLICNERTRRHDDMVRLLETSGELLPLPYEGEMYYVINVLNCRNCLDRENSDWGPFNPQKTGLPKKCVFDPARLAGVSLFKIPETSRIFCAEGLAEPRRDFKRVYGRLGLSGLNFVKLWSDGI
jgi:hypothetical protein